MRDLLVLGTLAVAAATSLAQDSSDVRLIPRQVLWGNPDKAQARISPDGKRLSFLAPVEGVLNVWVGPVDDPAAAKPVTNDRKRGIQEYFWTYTNRDLVYLQDRDGDENWRVYRVNLDSGEVKDLTPLEGVQARIEEVSHLVPGEILVGLNDRNKQLHDLYRINLETGERKLVLENQGFLGFINDDEYRVRIGVTMSPTGSVMAVTFGPDGKPRPLLTIAPEDVLTTNPVRLTKDGKSVYLISSQGRNTAALMAMDLETGATKLLAEDPRVDIGGAMLHPTEHTLQAYSTEYLRQEWHAVDPAVARDLEVLAKVARGDINVSSRTLDDRVWIVSFIPDDGPVAYYRYDRDRREAHFLFVHRQGLSDWPLAPLRPVVPKSRDGLDLVSYLTLPTWEDPDGNGRPAHPLPLVLWIHGGPWARDSWGYNPVHQWLANRGYAVLSVNYRGSTGFGKAFINAANREWGRKMHEDVVDAVQWAVREGIADPARVAITGGSYGGYETLAGLTMTPELFACGVDLVGPSNLVTFLEHVPEYWIPILPLLKDRVGDQTTEAGRAQLLEESPITYVDRIAKPLLIGQGANDPRVPQQESDQIVAAMREHHIPVTYALFSDEGHGFVRPENTTAFFALEEAFLAKHLGGRFEAVRDGFAGSSIKVLEGADGVPGLPAALEQREGR